MQKIKAILFDLDGVLVDSEPLHFEAHRRALEKVGISITKDDYIQGGISGGKTSFYDVMQAKYRKNIDVALVRKLKRDIYGELINEIKLFDGVKEVLEGLKGKYRMAIVSNTHLNYIHKTLVHVGVEKYFETFSSAKNLERGKPFPDVYLDAMEKLGLGSDECIAVEDSKNGVEAAKNANLKCIAIPNHFTQQQDLSRADIIIKNISELKENI